MLVITRKPKESIKIGDDVTIRFLRYDKKNNELRIGIEAPKNITIARTEIAFGFDGALREKLSPKSVDNKVGNPEVKVKSVKRWGTLCAPSGLPQE